MCPHLEHSAASTTPATWQQLVNQSFLEHAHSSAMAGIGYISEEWLVTSAVHSFVSEKLQSRAEQREGGRESGAGVGAHAVIRNRYDEKNRQMV